MCGKALKVLNIPSFWYLIRGSPKPFSFSLTIGVTIKFKFTKTDQLAMGQEVTLNREASGSCPCIALQLYLVARPEDGDLLLPHQVGDLLTQFHFRPVYR